MNYKIQQNVEKSSNMKLWFKRLLLKSPKLRKKLWLNIFIECMRVKRKFRRKLKRSEGKIIRKLKWSIEKLILRKGLLNMKNIWIFVKKYLISVWISLKFAIKNNRKKMNFKSKHHSGVIPWNYLFRKKN